MSVTPQVAQWVKRPMSVEETTRYRAMAARFNFLGCHRQEIQYAAKQALGWMSSPCQGGQDNLVRRKYLDGG